LNESFRVGRALGLGLSITFRNFVPFLLLGVLISLPEILYMWSATSDWAGQPTMEMLVELGWFVIKFLLIGYVCGILVISTFAYGVVMELKGQHASIGDTIVQGFRRFFPVLGVALLFGVLIVVVAFVVGFFAMRMETFGQILVRCAVGAIYAIYLCAIPAAVIERPGVSGALSRSSSLTQGRRGAIFAMLALVMLVKFGCTEIVSSMLIDQEALMEHPELMWGMLRDALWVTVAFDVLFSMFMAVLASVTYYLLRAEKEGTSADELAAVFD
jgi:hypothetical protein